MPWRLATEQEFQAWEALLAEGKEPYAAAREVEPTLTCSALKRGDRERYLDAIHASKEARGEYVDKVVEEKAVAEDAAPATVALWAKRWNPAYRERAEVNVNGTVRVEHKGVDAGELFEILAAAGAFESEADQALAALPGTRELLPARPE